MNCESGHPWKMDRETAIDTSGDNRQADSVRVRVTANGRIVIPAQVREHLGIKDGDELLLTRDGDSFRLSTYGQAIRRAQQRVAQYVQPGAGVDEFVRERAEEAEQEERELDGWYGSRAGR